MKISSTSEKEYRLTGQRIYTLWEGGGGGGQPDCTVSIRCSKLSSLPHRYHPPEYFLFFKKNKFYFNFWLRWVFVAACVGEQGPLFVAVRGLLIAVASLVGEHGLYLRRLSSCGTWAQ